MRRLVLVAAVVGAGACNALLGLEPAQQGGDGDAAIDAAADDAVDATADDGEPVPIDARDDGPSPLDARDAALPNDLDGDGVLDAADNCPTVPNVNQDNDDADPWGDVCDTCPFRLDLAPPANGDGDDLADDCGDPGTGAQCIAYFDGFGYMRTFANYASPAGHGTWTMAGDRVQQSLPAVDEGLLVFPGRTFAAPIVLTQAIIAQVDNAAPSGDTWEVGVWADAQNLQNVVADGIMGTFHQVRPETVARVGVRRHTAAGGDVASTAYTPGRGFQPSTIVWIALDARSTNLIAGVSFDAGMTLVTTGAAAPAKLPSGLVGLRTRNAAALFEFLMVLEPRVGGACPVRAEP